jgi:hypothetical protein
MNCQGCSKVPRIKLQLAFDADHTARMFAFVEGDLLVPKSLLATSERPLVLADDVGAAC